MRSVEFGGSSRLITITLVLLLITATGGTVGSGVESVERSNSSIPALDRAIDGATADEALVNEAGDIVFVYTQPHESRHEALTGEVAMHLPSGLAYSFVTGEFAEEGEQPPGSATISTRADSNVATSDGTIFLDDPERIESFDTTSTLTTTERESNAEFESIAVLVDPDALYSEVHTAGEITKTARTMQGWGSVDIAFPAEDEDVHTFALDERREMTITESSEGYEIEATEIRSVGAWERERWETREDAYQSLETRYNEIAIGLGGQASIELLSYDYDEDPRSRSVDIRYRVELTDVKDRLAERFAEEIDTHTEQHMSDSERRVLADRLAEVSIDELWVTYEQDGLDTSIEWTFALEQTDAITLGVTEVAGSSGNERWADRIDDVRTALAAQEAADLEETISWDASFVREDPKTHVHAQVSSDTIGWERYVTELEERGMEPFRGMTVAEYEASLDENDQLEIVYALETTNHLIAFETAERGLEVLEFEETGLSPLPSLMDLFETEVSVARFDVQVDEETFEFESGVMMNETAASALFEDERIHAISAKIAEDNLTVYVKVPGAVSEEPSVSAIREHERVGSETTISFPATWDEAYPSVRSNEIRSFLDQEVETDDDQSRILFLTAVGLLIIILVFGTRYASSR